MKRLSNILCTVVPWMFFWGGKALEKPAWGISGAMLSMGVLCWVGKHRMKAPDWTQLLFFFLALAAIFHTSFHWASTHQALLAPGLFTLMAFGSLLVRHPFTIEYAKEEVPAQFWEDPGFPPHFDRVNKILTWLWACVFALSLGCAWFATSHTWALNWILQALPPLAFILATLLTKFFPLWYQKNYYEPFMPRPKMA